VAPKTFMLEILTPQRRIFRGDVVSLVVPAERGYLGVLAHHAPMIAALQAGRIALRQDGSSRVFQARGSGFLEVAHHQATVLMDEVAEGAG
jgi:F-type H+-transporting ATPase subunit epsilon